jgi:hypothetical protein
MLSPGFPGPRGFQKGDAGALYSFMATTVLALGSLRRHPGIVTPTTQEIEDMLIQFWNRLLLAVIFSACLTTVALADNSAVLGEWDITIEDDYFDEADLEITLVIEEEDGELTGTWESERGDDDLEDVEWNGKTLSFVRELEFMGRDVDVEHTAKVTGDTLEGEMELPRREVDFSGERGDGGDGDGDDDDDDYDDDDDDDDDYDDDDYDDDDYDDDDDY